MEETSQLRKLITKRGIIEILIPLCCTTNPVRYLTFRNSMKGFSSKTLAIRLKELEKSGILKRKTHNEILLCCMIIKIHDFTISVLSK